MRGEDHPVAGVVPDPLAAQQDGDLLLYLHHAVRGITYRTDRDTYVAAYRLPAAKLRAWTEAALLELDTELAGRSNVNSIVSSNGQPRPIKLKTLKEARKEWRARLQRRALRRREWVEIVQAAGKAPTATQRAA